MSCFLQKSENISVHIQQVSLGDIVELADKAPALSTAHRCDTVNSSIVSEGSAAEKSKKAQPSP